MTVRTKLRLIFAVFFALLGGLTYYSSGGLKLLEGNLHYVTNEITPDMKRLEEISSKVSLFRINEASHILSLAATDMDAREADMKRLAGEIDTLGLEFLGGSRADSVRTTFGLFQDSWKKYLAVNAKLLPISRQYDSHEHIDFLDQATGIFNKESMPLFQEAVAPLNELVQAKIKEGDAATAEASVSVSEHIRNGLIAAVLAGLIGVAAIVIFERTVLRLLVQMSALMETLAKGDHSVEIVGAERTDEIGMMAKSVAIFKDGMIEAERLRGQQEELRRKGEIEKRAAMHKLADDFEASVRGIVDALSSAATELQASAESMSTTAKEADQQAGSVARASDEASHNVQTVASATEELSSSVDEISRQVAESTRIAGAAVKEAAQTRQSVQSMAEMAERIGAVVTLINDIASQTNLLALNATIEAARAGEAGKGFAVVASEVKNLANQTAKATEEISAQIGGVQQASTGSVTAIEGISTTIGRVSEIATAIAAAIEEQGAATREIARNVQEAAGTNEVSTHISGVSKAASETGAAATQVLGAASQLAQQSEMLRKQVGQFLSTVRAA
jgi:methyl-accepting chemotaxis protein